MSPSTINFPKHSSIQTNNTSLKQNQNPTTEVKDPNKNLKIGAGIGLGLACLATGGIYIARRGGNRAAANTQSAAAVFESLQNTSTSIIDTLKDAKMTKAGFKELMFKITSSEETGERFIREVTADPRKSKTHAKMLKEKIGGTEELLDWIIQPKGYQEAYYKHSHKVYNEAKKPDDLIGISPNWNIWVMKDKFGHDFSFGELPQEIGNADKYREVFYAGLNNGFAGYEHSGVKFGDYIGGGLSGKCVRKLKIGEKDYILKYQPDTHNVDINDNISMKSDSAFLNAQLERYLDLHNYTQGPKLKFYDYKTNSALYEMSEGVPLDKSEVSDIVAINKKLGDLNDLGVYYNDLNASNFRVKDGVTSFIDSGESSFVDVFKPGVTALHFTLPNLNGRSITESAAAVTLAK